MSETTETTGLNSDIATDEGNINESNLESTQENSNIEDSGNTDNENNLNAGQENAKDNSENSYYGAPENYNFNDIQLPEGFTIDEALAAEFAPLGKELNLSQQGANKLAQLLIKYQQSQVTPERIAEYKKQEAATTQLRYEKMLSEDKEIGGGDETKMNAYVDVADVGYKAFASDELKSLLQELSLDYHPAVIKHFYRLGKLCGNDVVKKTSSSVPDKLTPAQILFGGNKTEE